MTGAKRDSYRFSINIQAAAQLDQRFYSAIRMFSHCPVCVADSATRRPSNGARISVTYFGEELCCPDFWWHVDDLCMGVNGI